MNTEQLDRIKKLQDGVRTIVESPENERRIAFWEKQEGDARDHWRGIPKRGSRKAPFYADCENSMWSRILGFDLKEYYNDPAVYLESQLRMMLFRFRNFDDDACAGKVVPIWLGVPFEPSFFGVEVVFEPGADPWIGKKPVINDESDLARLPRPDFYKSGLMPVAHRLYSGIGELLDEDFTVAFPEWGRSPFAVALHLRGMDRIVMDMYDRPSFVRELINFIAECRMEWTRERFKFMKTLIQPGNLYNDEVNCPLLSPGMYRDFVLPSEQRLSAFHGGIAYWHSCGNTTDLMRYIKEIPNLRMFHRGPWTDLNAAVEVFGPDIAIEICLDPASDIQMATEESMRQQVEWIKATCDGRVDYTIRIEGSVIDSADKALQKVKQYVDVTRSVLG
ncbi:MAG: hypothetical protein HPY71_12260 [Firmicutes bacterium]|nr:hypothetical protein [Bacillota bacterium]